LKNLKNYNIYAMVIQLFGTVYDMNFDLEGYFHIFCEEHC